MLVFLDESACNHHTTRQQYAWAASSCRAYQWDFFVCGQRFSILPAISLDGVLHLDILTCSWTEDTFTQYVEVLLTCMNPYPLKNSMLVMDNMSQHHFEGLRDIIEAQCGFSAMKTWLRLYHGHSLACLPLGMPTAMDPFYLLWDAVYQTMPPINIRGWFSDCGYVI
ncbi:hypothetical protein FIBSPDRAFT_754756 [Athelia psychrophila]|uniref:Tc1-like transposase DDE domain-containing protein n=1 Tax=Athelia psychrophila TaxID=1759441 RepID=A0A166BDQ0_9AGAM|nr:hypothetical protein FIBSPDRAFT_754756 [Fibularhizoctonia sp. CBS 109695]